MARMSFGNFSYVVKENPPFLFQSTFVCVCLYIPSPPMPTGQYSRMLLLATVKQSIQRRLYCEMRRHKVHKFTSNESVQTKRASN